MSYKVEKEWTSKEGYPCVAIINTSLGNRCGYVGIPPGHPLHGVSYSDDCPALRGGLQDATHEPVGKRGILALVCFAANGGRASMDVVFDVHGSVTFTGDGKDGCPVYADVWWVGFDCGHAGDGHDIELMNEEMQAFYRKHPELQRVHEGDIVRTLDYVVQECENLAEQLKRVADGATINYDA